MAETEEEMKGETAAEDGDVTIGGKGSGKEVKEVDKSKLLPDNSN